MDFDAYAHTSKALRGVRQSESTVEQIEGCRRDGEHCGLQLRHVFADDGISASRYAGLAVREGYEQLLDSLRDDLRGSWLCGSSLGARETRRSGSSC